LKAAWLSITSPKRKEGRKMSEDRTKEVNDPRSFEERVFARFDTVDERFDRVEGRLSAVEIRITNLEARQYDTKPIWEQALAQIAETNRTIQELRSEFQTGIEGLRIELKSEFTAVRHEMEHGQRVVARTIDTLNRNFLEVQTYQRYVDRRLEYLEAKVDAT
jgi:chromosome segregation ATPase